MKKTMLLLIAMAMFLGFAYAQFEDENIDLRFLNLDQAPVISNVYFGIYVSELDPDDAEDLGYYEDYGILITEVVDGSPACEAGLEEDDIIMAINEDEITDLAEFDRVRAELEPGDVIYLTYWHEGELREIEMTMQARPGAEVKKQVIVMKDEMPRKKKLSVGYGGGSWIPVWFNTEMSDVNELIANFGYGSDAISDKGVILNGGAGKGNVGKGFFIGGVGAGYSWERKLAGDDTKISYDLSFGGATLDKRFALARNFVASVGVMLGAGTHEVKYTKYDQDYDWNDPDATANFTTKATREFFAVQPRAELLYELLGWLGIRAEVGYMFGYSGKEGWQVKADNGDDYHIANSPNTPYQGLTISIGPWFGF